jgi:glycerol kinase
MLGINVIRPKVIEITSLGAAYLAGLAIGYWKNANEIKKCWKKDKVFNPKMPKKTAADLYHNWLKAVKLTLSK